MFGKVNDGVIREGFMTEKEMKRFSKGADMGKKILLSKHLQRMKDISQSRMNNSFLLIGERGETSKNFVIPNIKEHNSSYVVIDPEGEIYGQVKDDLDGYTVKCMDLSSGMKDGAVACYNPFHYAKAKKDVINLLECLLGDNSGFFGGAKNNFLAACIFHFLEHNEDLSFCTLWEFVSNFIGNEFEKDDKDGLAVEYYGRFSHTAVKQTQESVIKGCASLLEQYLHLDAKDQLGLDKMQEEHIALFIIPPKETDKAADNVISLLLSQLCDMHSGVSHAENVHVKPDHTIECIFMDMKHEKNFDLPYYSAVMHTDEVNFVISISAVSQLKDIYDDKWRDVAYNFETWIFYSTYAKDTLDLVCKETGGKVGFQFFHPLLTLDELDDLAGQGKCLVLQWGQKPAIDDPLTADIE